jgi:hypothetical protein
MFCREVAMPAVAEPPVFTETELKLLRLALNQASHPGEIDGAGRALIASWRKRGLNPDTVLGTGTLAIKGNPYAATIFAFGKHRGKRLDEIPVEYLLWVLDHCDHLWPQTRTAIQRFLDQSNG